MVFLPSNTERERLLRLLFEVRKTQIQFWKASSYIALENSTREQDSAPEQSSPPEQCFPPQQQQINSDPFSSDYEGSFLDGFSDLDSSDNEIDTVAYHLSVSKDRLALHPLGIRTKNVVSVEISAVSRTVVRTWWEQTNQKGNLYHHADVQELNADRLEHYINTFGGFDLVVGGSPCNNLAGSNRYHRDGLEGKESSLFYDYFRILDLVKGLMARYS
ncbi:DNA (cytosine-5)-methyltransferase DRM1A-like isoform X2 [Rosa rugosa]|uniref:DNA (cytosine-5)-methyltransferase DRM1A-like isoform X2 n=1 Tax=Rosa rugosa TaxID=74645 RepID=UPI002B410D3D|nr:DNA (cytosine-5)-methyltransferase DRM1A-like isoform X2 [Rosa rugosa]